MVDAGVMEDYTCLWYDVRPHPNFGTVEIRAMDAQTHVEHTLGAGGADPGDGQGARRALRRGQAARAYPYEMLDENKWLAARHGLEGELVDLPERRIGATKELARRLYDRLREHAQDLGGATSSRRSRTCSRRARAPPASASSTRPTTTGRSCCRDREATTAD
jgi:carboxylate-amine ligase